MNREAEVAVFYGAVSLKTLARFCAVWYTVSDKITLHKGETTMRLKAENTIAICVDYQEKLMPGIHEGEEVLKRVHAPIGLDIGGETPLRSRFP